MLTAVMQMFTEVQKASEWSLLLLCSSELDSDEGSVLDSSFYATVQMFTVE